MKTNHKNLGREFINVNGNLYVAIVKINIMGICFEDIQDYKSGADIQLYPIVRWWRLDEESPPIPYCVGLGLVSLDPDLSCGIYDKNIGTYTVENDCVLDGESAADRFKKWALTDIYNKQRCEKRQTIIDALIE